MLGSELLTRNFLAVENLTITPMFDDPVIVLEGQPMRAAFQTNLAINSGVGVQTYFQSNPQGLTTPPSLNLEVGKSDWLVFPSTSQHTRPANWRMKWYRGTELIFFVVITVLH